MSKDRKRRRWLITLPLLLALAGLIVLCERQPVLRQRLWPDESAYDAIIMEVAARHQAPPALIKAVIKQESNFNPLAVGAAGERGLMQLMGPAVTDWERATGRRCLHPGLLFSPRLNIEIGTWYLVRGLRRWEGYRGQTALALAEYNAGPSRAQKWAPEDPNEEFLPQVRFPGTKSYIVKILKYQAEYETEFRTLAGEIDR